MTAASLLPDAGNVDKHGFLFGYPIAHSMSPFLHNTTYQGLGLNWHFSLFESTDMAMFLRRVNDPQCFGAAVTMPHKVAVIPFLDELTDEGRSVGACNTVFFRQEGSRRILIGTNTDTIGIREAFYQNLQNPDDLIHGRPGLVVGGGGAARAAVYALKSFMKCKTVYLVNRDPAEIEAVSSWCIDHGYGDGLVHVATASQAEGLEGPGAIVACVPDIIPNTEEEKAARGAFEVFLSKPHKGAILEMAYHPAPWTAIANLAQQMGWTVILGTEAMIWQGIEQNKFWTGKELSSMPVDDIKSIIATKISESRH